jgi:patatin-like phospholipase/acyl hydrolase
MILAEIEERTGRGVAALLYLIAGTSTGGILALGLTVHHQQKKNKPRYRAHQLVVKIEKLCKLLTQRIEATTT